MGEQAAPTVTIGVDVGGTFTDIVVSSRRDGRLAIDKVLSTPGNLWLGIMEGLRKVIGDEKMSETLTAARIIHATTQATNAIIESKTAKVALITNRGFRDVLEIRRHYRSRLYDLNMQLPPCLVPRDLRLEIDARLDHRGNELVSVNPEQVAELARWCRSQGVEGYAVSLLHAYVNPKQEQVVADALRAAHPDAFISCSSSVCPEYREYERTSTTVVNAAVMPIVDTYLERLEAELQNKGYGRDLYIMQSNGGMMTARDIRLTPVNIIESGPAAGVVAAAAVGRQTGRSNVLSFDMGGTTAKAALIRSGSYRDDDRIRGRQRKPWPWVGTSGRLRAASARDGNCGGRHRRRQHRLDRQRRSVAGGTAQRRRRTWARLLRQGRYRTDDHGCEFWFSAHLAPTISWAVK